MWFVELVGQVLLCVGTLAIVLSAVVVFLRSDR